MAFGMYDTSRLVLDIDLARFLDARFAGSAVCASDSFEDILLALCWPAEVCSCCPASTDAVWLATSTFAVRSVQ